MVARMPGPLLRPFLVGTVGTDASASSRPTDTSGAADADAAMAERRTSSGNAGPRVVSPVSPNKAATGKLKVKEICGDADSAQGRPPAPKGVAWAENVDSARTEVESSRASGSGTSSGTSRGGGGSAGGSGSGDDAGGSAAREGSGGANGAPGPGPVAEGFIVDPSGDPKVRREGFSLTPHPLSSMDSISSLFTASTCALARASRSPPKWCRALPPPQDAAAAASYGTTIPPLSLQRAVEQPPLPPFSVSAPRLYNDFSVEPIGSLLSYRSGLSGRSSVISVDRGTAGGPTSADGTFGTRLSQQDEKRRAMERRWDFMVKERNFLNDLVEFYRHPNTGRLLQSSPFSELVVRAYEQAGLKEPPLPDMSAFLDIEEMCRLLKHVREWSSGECEATLAHKGMGLGGGERPKWWARLQAPAARIRGAVGTSFRQRSRVGPRAVGGAPSFSEPPGADAAAKGDADKDADAAAAAAGPAGPSASISSSSARSSSADTETFGPVQHASDGDRMLANVVQWHYGRSPAAQKTFTAREGGLQLSTLGQARGRALTLTPLCCCRLPSRESAHVPALVVAMRRLRGGLAQSCARLMTSRWPVFSTADAVHSRTARADTVAAADPRLGLLPVLLPARSCLSPIHSFTSICCCWSLPPLAACEGLPLLRTRLADSAFRPNFRFAGATRRCRWRSCG